MDELELYSVDLIKRLEEKYYEKCPDFNETEKEIFYYKGKVDLVKELIKLRDNEQLEEINYINNKKRGK